jgi:hypothetical protein
VAYLLAWSLAGLCVAIFVADVPLYTLTRSSHVPSSWAAKSLEEFSAKLRNETDMDALNSELLSTVQPEHASLWLREPEKPG